MVALSGGEPHVRDLERLVEPINGGQQAAAKPLSRLHLGVLAGFSAQAADCLDSGHHRRVLEAGFVQGQSAEFQVQAGAGVVRGTGRSLGAGHSRPCLVGPGRGHQAEHHDAQVTSPQRRRDVGERERGAAGLDPRIGGQRVHLGDTKADLGFCFGSEDAAERGAGEFPGLQVTPRRVQEYRCFGYQRRAVRVSVRGQRQGLPGELARRARVGRGKGPRRLVQRRYRYLVAGPGAGR